MKTVCLASLKFSPGHYSHVMGFKKLFEFLGFKVFLLLHENYINIGNFSDDFNVKLINDNTIKKVLKETPKCDLILFQNPSIQNVFVAKFFKTTGAKVIVYYHEPWRGVEYYIKRGVKRLIEATAVEFFTSRVLEISDAILVGSSFGYTLSIMYKNHLRERLFYFPLIFDDELSEDISGFEKKSFSFIGHSYYGHGFDIFINTIKEFFMNGWHSVLGLNFEVATPTNLDKKLESDKVLVKMLEDGVLKVSHGKPLSNDEINMAFSRSICVWNGYRFVVQSGVLPKAYMFGTPVLATRVGSFPEFVQHGRNGFFLDSYDPVEIYEYLFKLRDNFQNMTVECRKTFEETFLWKANVERMKKIIERIE